VCLVGVWQCNFEHVVCVCTVRPAGPYTHTHHRVSPDLLHHMLF